MLVRCFAVALVLTSLNCHKPDELMAAYEGCATDENGLALDDYESTGRVKTDASAIPKWAQQTANPTGEYPSATTPTLRWQPSASDAGSDSGNVTCAEPASLRPTGLTPLHEAAISGVVYDLRFSVDDAVAYRVLTTRQHATVPQDVWSGWGGKNVTVELVSAKLLKNDVVEGPYRAPMLSFHVAK